MAGVCSAHCPLPTAQTQRFMQAIPTGDGLIFQTLENRTFYENYQLINLLL